MRYINFFLFSIVLMVSGCASQSCKPEKGVVLKGTVTAIVGVFIDEKGYPQASVNDVTVYPGQKIVFAGPEKFDIIFKDQKSPIGKLEIQSTNGIVTLDIPRDIFERNRASQNATDDKTKGELLFRYGIRANGRVTDPTIHIVER